MNIEKILLPQGDILQVDNDGGGSVQILDAELDRLDCHPEDGAVEINTEGYSYITLTLENLRVLKRIIHQFDKRNKP